MFLLSGYDSLSCEISNDTMTPFWNYIVTVSATTSIGTTKSDIEVPVQLISDCELHNNLFIFSPYLFQLPFYKSH